jgi:hypothetical protein
MKQELSEYTNKEYVEYLDENLYLLITLPHKHRNVELIRKKIKGNTLAQFDQILTYRALRELANTANKSIPHSFFDTEIINKKRILSETKKEVEGMMDSYLESINNEEFLNSISEISYWMTKIELKEQIEIHKKHLYSWIEWHVYLEKKNKGKREGEKIKEKLRLILGDKIDDFEKIYEEHQKNIERLKAGKERVFVNIDHEIDITTATSDESLTLPNEWLGENKDFRVIKENDKCISYKGKVLSLKEYFENIRSEINQTWLKSKNILKQIIVIYLIKRCQKGDEQAHDILFNLYKNSTEKLEINFMKQYKNIDTFEIKGRGLNVLSTLLKGNSPSLIYKYLDKGRLDKKELDFLNKKPHLALNETYETMFGVVKNQLERLIYELKHLEKNTKEYRNRLKKAKPSTRIRYNNNIFQLSQHTLSRISFFPTTFMLFDPIIFLNISPKHNKYLFKPAPNRNLTTWLLGDGTGNWKGVIWQELCNSFLGRKSNSNESYDEYENNYTEDPSGIYIKNKIGSQED